MIFKKMDNGEIEKIKKLPKNAVRIHLYNVQNVLRPRGGKLQKESLSLYIYDKLNSVYEDWTNLDYGDNPSKKELLEIVENNMIEEVQLAWEKFKENIKESNNIIQFKKEGNKK